MNGPIQVIVISLFRDKKTEQIRLRIQMPDELVERGIDDFDTFVETGDACLDFVLGEIARSSNFERWLCMWLS